MTMPSILVCLTLILTSCNSTNWQGGRITKEGVYQTKEVKIVVGEHNYAVNYVMLSAKGDTLIAPSRTFSSVQRWAFHLDSDQSLWVFSSDIGHSCWRRNSSNGKYFQLEYLWPISKDSISADVYSTFKTFNPNPSN